MIINRIVFYLRYTCTILNWSCLLKFPQTWQQTHANACPVWCSMRKSSKEILWVCGDNRYKCWSCFDSWEPLQKHRYLRLPISQQQQIYMLHKYFYLHTNLFPDHNLNNLAMRVSMLNVSCKLQNYIIVMKFLYICLPSEFQFAFIYRYVTFEVVVNICMALLIVFKHPFN